MGDIADDEPSAASVPDRACLCGEPEVSQGSSTGYAERTTRGTIREWDAATGSLVEVDEDTHVPLMSAHAGALAGDKDERIAIATHQRDSTRTLRRSAPRLAARSASTDALTFMSRLIVELGRQQRRIQFREQTSDSSESPSHEEEGDRFAGPWRINQRQVLADLQRGDCAYEPIFNQSGAPVPPLELRSFVPTSHGLGYRYNWKTEGPFHVEYLFDVIEDRKKTGWRLYSVNLSAYTEDPLSPWIDAIFVRDDDSNFDTGASLVSGEELLSQTIPEMLERGRRPICILNTSAREENGFYIVVWIEDKKYIGEGEWIVLRHTLSTFLAEAAEVAAQGYRPISATICKPYSTVIYVRDFSVNWRVAWFETSDDAQHPIEYLHAKVPDTIGFIPISLDGKREDDDPNGKPLWVAVLSEDDDLDTVDQPLKKWRYYTLDTNGVDADAGSVPSTQLKNEKRRLCVMPSLVPVASEHSARRYYVVDCEVPVPRCRVVHDEGALEALFSQMPAFGDLTVADVIDLLVLDYMRFANIPSVSIAIRDSTGFRMRAAYTFAPYAYPLTYPETRFRTGSVSKMITAIAAWRAMEIAGVNEDQPIFELLPERWQPSIVDIAYPDPNTGYPPALLDLTIDAILRHRTGWRDKLVHPGGSKDPRWVADVAARLPTEFTGWRTLEGIGLLPLVRDDYMLFMLRREAFTREKGTLSERVGWDPDVDSLPGSKSRYSGFAYDLLGAAIERLVGVDGLSHPGADYHGFASFTDAVVLEHLSMSHTIAGHTPRLWADPAEVVYQVDPYLEEEAKPATSGSDDFNPTRLYTIEAWSTPQEPVEPEDAYNDGAQDQPIPSTVTTPRYPALSYGAYRLESALPRGGWVSTAPDLCRFTDVFTSNAFASPVGLSPVAATLVRSDPGAGEYNLGGIGQTYVSPNDGTVLLGKSGMSRDATKCEVSFDPGTKRAISWCRLLGKDEGNYLTGLIYEALKGLGL